MGCKTTHRPIKSVLLHDVKVFAFALCLVDERNLWNYWEPHLKIKRNFLTVYQYNFETTKTVRLKRLNVERVKNAYKAKLNIQNTISTKFKF